jgi:hypothetical protein
LPGLSPEHSVHGPYSEVARINLGEVVGLDLVKESFSCHGVGKRIVRYQGQVRRMLRI